jgi:putative ABC transport system permease protein
MTPAQVVGMMIASACVLGVVGGALGAPLGVWLHQTLLDLMGNIVNDPVPPGLSEGVFTARILALLALAGVAVAAIGAGLPAWLASRQSVAETLRAE